MMILQCMHLRSYAYGVHYHDRTLQSISQMVTMAISSHIVTIDPRKKHLWENLSSCHGSMDITQAVLTMISVTECIMEAQHTNTCELHKNYFITGHTIEDITRTCTHVCIHVQGTHTHNICTCNTCIILFLSLSRIN